MRGLIGVLLLVPVALAAESAAAEGLRKGRFEHGREHFNGDSESVENQLTASVRVPVPAEPYLNWEHDALRFKFEVLQSDQPCGFGNVTIDGQVLPQTLVNGISSGTGSISTADDTTVVASWNFLCVNVNGTPDYQLLKFVVGIIDGHSSNVGFSALFRQNGAMEIVHIETDLSIPDEILANPNPFELRPLRGDKHEDEYDMEHDMFELQYLHAQMRELKHLIREKKREIAHRRRHHRFHHGNGQVKALGECDSLKCVVNYVTAGVKNRVQGLYGKFGGGEPGHRWEGDHGDDHWKGKNPHFPHLKFPGHKGNCTGDHGHHGHHKGNHTHSGPPHHWLPICRYPPPPPPPHGRFPHHPPPPPPHGGFQHHPPHHPPPPPHGPPGHDHDDFGEPDHHHEGSPDGDHDDFDKPDHRHEGPPHRMPPSESDPPHRHEDFEGPPPHGGEQLQDGPPDFDMPPTPFDMPPSPFESLPPLPLYPHGPPPFRPGRHDGSPPYRLRPVVKFTAIGFLFTFLLLAFHRRVCTPDRRATRQTRREARDRRRASRRAAHKHIITRLLNRMSGRDDHDMSDDDVYGDEEKRVALLTDAEDGISTTMTEDIAQLRTAAEVVGEIVVAAEARVVTTHVTTQTQDVLIPGSILVAEEELPAYEDSDESSSVISDGFRYTPGNGMGNGPYTLTHSSSGDGSVSDILGPDNKA